MQYIRGLSNYNDSGKSAVTFGKFDGLHKGHQKLVKKVREFGEKNKINSIVCAFDMRPLWEEKGLNPQLLMNGKEQQMHLEGQVDYLIECPFTREFSQIPAEEFIKDIIKGLFHADYVVVGTDFCFGHDKQGDIHMLAAYEKECGYDLVVVEKERYEDRIISSTYVKEVLRTGDMKLASRLLGYPYGLTGIVEHGKKLGRTLGFPTFNVAWPKAKIAPPNGVYLCDVTVDKDRYHGIANVGVKPTVTSENRLLIESFLFGYAGSAYGKEVTIELLSMCRPEQKFDSIEEMKACIDRDIEAGKHFFGMGK